MAINAATITAYELATCLLKGNVQDELGSAQGYDDIDVFQCSLCDKTTGTIINSRLHQDIKGDGRTFPQTEVNGGWIDSAGNWQLKLRPADNIIIGSNQDSGQEEHELLLFVLRNSTASGSLTNAISVTSGDKTVTVAHTGHGLVVGDDVTLQGADDVGGLNCNGNRVVTAVPTANSYQFEHADAGTSDEASAGGSVDWWKGGDVSYQPIPIPILALAKAPA